MLILIAKVLLSKGVCVRTTLPASHPDPTTSLLQDVRISFALLVAMLANAIVSAQGPFRCHMAVIRLFKKKYPGDL